MMIAFRDFFCCIETKSPKAQKLIEMVKEMEGSVSSDTTIKDWVEDMNLLAAAISRKNKIEYRVRFVSHKGRFEDFDHGEVELTKYYWKECAFTFAHCLWHEVRSIIGRDANGNIVKDPTLQIMVERYPKKEGGES